MGKSNGDDVFFFTWWDIGHPFLFFHQEASLGIAFLLWKELGFLVIVLLSPKVLVLDLLIFFFIIAWIMAMLALALILSLVRLGAIWRDVSFFSIIVVCFVLVVSSWSEYPSFGGQSCNPSCWSCRSSVWNFSSWEQVLYHHLHHRMCYHDDRLLHRLR